MKVTKVMLKALKKLGRESTKSIPLGTKILEDKRTKRSRTRTDQNRKAIKDSSND